MTHNEDEMRRALRQFTDTVEITGGLVPGSLGPVFAPRWLDLGLAYNRAVKVLAETAPHTPPESPK